MKIGDTVVIIDTWEIYPNFPKAVSELGLKRWSTRILHDDVVFNEVPFKIVASTEMEVGFASESVDGEPEIEVCTDTLYGIENIKTGEQFVISKKGIKKL